MMSQCVQKTSKMKRFDTLLSYLVKVVNLSYLVEKKYILVEKAKRTKIKPIIVFLVWITPLNDLYSYIYPGGTVKSLEILN